MKVHLVARITGDYEDRCVYVSNVFADKETAIAFALFQNKALARLGMYTQEREDDSIKNEESDIRQHDETVKRLFPGPCRFQTAFYRYEGERDLELES